MVELTFGKQDDEGCPSGQSSLQDLARQDLARQDLIDNLDPIQDLSPYVQTRANGDSTLDLMISGAHCSACLAKIERAISALPDVKIARMNLSTMRLNIQWTGKQTNAAAIVSTNIFGLLQKEATTLFCSGATRSL